MSKNFGQMVASLSKWARETVDQDVARDALNDGIETIWSKVVEAQVSQMVGGPVTLSLAAASERTQLTSIVDPVAAPVVTALVEGALAQHTPFVAYSIATESGSETLMSPVVSNVVIAANSVASTAAPARVPSGFGWNLYAGSTLASMCRQNPAPLPFGLPYVEPEAGFFDAGDELGGPLPPTENTTADDVFYIRKLETPLTAGGFKEWDQVTIDSQMFKWASRSIASNSEYQPYYYDLLNGRTLEYRPALGTTFPAARYFFIHRPRRILFDNATIPFYTFPWEEALRSYALAAWKRTQEEWPGAQAWQELGDVALQRSCSLLRQQDWDKNLTITPYRA